MKRILIVDDEEAVAELICGIIRELIPGVEIIREIDLEGANNALEEKGPFDLIMTDFNLTKGGTEGAKVTQLTKIIYPDVPVIVVSGSLQDDEDRIRRMCAADSYLAKPFYIVELIATISIHLGKIKSPV